MVQSLKRRLLNIISNQCQKKLFFLKWLGEAPYRVGKGVIEKNNRTLCLYLSNSKLQGLIIDYQKQQIEQKLMNSQFHHDLFSYGYFPDPYFPPFMNHMYFTPWNQNLFTTSVKLNQESDLPNQIVKSEIQAPAFQAKAVPNVIIKKKEKLVSCRSSKDREFNSPSAKSSIKSIKFQKENRNVVSNLLRVFLKNILEVHSYDSCIDLVINRNNLKITGTQFFSWLVSFKINFKNYIKPKQIMRIINDKHSEEHQLVFRVLMRQFVDSLGVSHCLTSKRLDSICSRRHIEGLRELLTLREEQSQ